MVCDLVLLRKVLQDCRALWQHKAICLLQHTHTVLMQMVFLSQISRLLLSGRAEKGQLLCGC